MIKASTRKNTGNALADAYLEGNRQVVELFHYDLHNPLFAAERAAEVDANFAPWRRQALVEVLRGQARVTLGLDAPSTALLDKLAAPDCLTVVTGQQAGIFTGPLYTLYKAITAVAYASYYENLLQRPVVPIFWVAAEDHDFQEVADAWYIKENGDLRRARLREQPIVRTPVGFHRISREELRRLLDELAVHLPEGLYREELLRDVSSAYADADNMVEGFIRLLAKWMENFPMLYPKFPLKLYLHRLLNGKSFIDYFLLFG